MNCDQLDPLVTPYVDGELDGPSRADVDAHLRRCPPCHSRVSGERSVRDLLHARRAALLQDGAPAPLRARCAEIAHRQPRAVDADDAEEARAFRRSPRARTFSPIARPFALAATLVVIVGGAFLYQLTDRSERVLAAELVTDHMKCFGINRMLGTRQAPAAVESSMASGFGWRVQLPLRPAELGLELIGARPCLYAEGRVAHIMYRHNGEPVSVFMLPRTTRPNAVVDVMGHEAAIWSAGDRTFVLIAREPREEVERMASFIHAELR